MNPAVDGFRLVVSQTDLVRPEAPLKVTVCGHGLTPIERRLPPPRTTPFWWVAISWVLVLLALAAVLGYLLH
jgi:hypothetical protein